tara:strand:- start:43 stop:630 length:588 start_codon:yes stop_codon:yes gene_type:complete
MKDFIGFYPKSIPDDFCDHIIKIITTQKTFSKPRQDSHRQDTQILLESAYPSVATEVMNFVGNKLMDYIDEEVPFYQKSTFISSTTLLQKTEPLEGYHAWHAENTTWDLYDRSLAWMVYLNDVQEGGETEFFYQQKKFKPTKGTTLIWPGGFTHMHRGNPPMSTKYIITGWFQLDGAGSFYKHVLKRDNNSQPPA